MGTEHQKPKIRWMRVFSILLIVGLLMPATPASAETPTMVSLPAVTGSNLIKDPSFEASISTNAYWIQSSTNFGTPLCTVGICGTGNGTAGPYSGSAWVWFGGTSSNEIGSLSLFLIVEPNFNSIFGLVRLPTGATQTTNLSSQLTATRCFRQMPLKKIPIKHIH
jgi:hypothetical protein